MALNIPSPDADSRVQRQRTKHAALLARLADAEAKHSGLLEDAAELIKSRHEAAVAFQLGDGQGPAEIDKRITSTREAIASAASDVAVLKDACSRQDVIARAERKQVIDELRVKVAAEVRTAVRRQAVLLSEVETLQNAVVHPAAQSGLVPSSNALCQLLTVLPAWRRNVEKLCAGDEPAVPTKPSTRTAQPA